MLTLAEEGRTQYSIVVAAQAPQPVEQAAQELADFLNRMTRADFPVVRDTAAVSEFEIVLGETSRKSLADLPLDLLPQAWEGFSILPEGTSLYLMGGQIARGTLYAVYDFLEQELGVRYLAPEVTYLPRSRTLRVAVRPRRYDPPFEYRAHYPPNNARSGYGEWMGRSRINSEGIGYGSVRRVGQAVHTFAYLVPPGEYFEQHPEMFALIGGKRISATLCLSNPDTVRVATQTALAWASQAGDDPETKYIVQVSQNDSGAYCECPDCAAVDAEEGTPFTGSLIRFVNAVAGEVGRAYPNVYVDTLAYITSEVPPQLTAPEPNVIIWFAPIGLDQSRPLDEPQINYHTASAATGMLVDLGLSSLQRTADLPSKLKGLHTWENLRGWAALTKNIYVWDYPQSFHDFLVPYPSLWAVGRNLQLVHEAGATGYFPQQPNTDGTEMRYLRNYVIAQLQWRPDRDPWALAEEFCRLYYGPRAGEHILRYLDHLHDSWRQQDRPLWWGGYKCDELVQPTDRILSQATVAEPRARHRERIAEFRLPIWRLMLTQAFGEVGKVRSLPRQWWYREDAADRGEAERWYQLTDFTGWTPVEIPVREFGTGGGHGAGWYAVHFDLPETNGAPLALHFATMNGEWDVYLNGSPVAQHQPAGLGYYQEVPYVRLDTGLPAGRHTLVVRVRDGSGFCRLLQLENPDFTTADAVTIVDLSQPLPEELRAAAEGFLAASRKAGIMRIFYGYGGTEPYLEQVLWPKVEFLLQHGK